MTDRLLHLLSLPSSFYSLSLLPSPGSVHTHSSCAVGAVSKSLSGALEGSSFVGGIASGVSSRAAFDLALTLIWKDVARGSEMMVAPHRYHRSMMMMMRMKMRMRMKMMMMMMVAPHRYHRCCLRCFIDESLSLHIGGVASLGRLP